MQDQPLDDGLAPPGAGLEVITQETMFLFTDWLESNFDGFNVEASACLAELVTAVQAIRKPGTITVSFRIEPFSADSMVIDGDKVVTITPKLTTSLPVETRPKKLMFATANGVLQTNAPNTRPLPLQD